MVCALSNKPPLHQLLQLWEKNGYFDDSIIQQLQSPALGLGQYQVSTTQPGHPSSGRLKLPADVFIAEAGCISHSLCFLGSWASVLSGSAPVLPPRRLSSMSTRQWCSLCSWPFSSRSRASRHSTRSSSAAWPSSSSSRRSHSHSHSRSHRFSCLRWKQM